MAAGNSLYVIAGGDGKGADFSPLQSVISKHVTKVYTLGKDGDEVALIAKKAGTKSCKVTSVEEATSALDNIVKSGDIVLLSPACASIDMFKNFAERGDVFVNAVNKLTSDKKAQILRERN